jgi:hypothetical protein
MEGHHVLCHQCFLVDLLLNNHFGRDRLAELLAAHILASALQIKSCPHQLNYATRYRKNV